MPNDIISIRYSSDSLIYNDPEQWVTQINGEVTCFEDDDSEPIISKIKCYYADLNNAIEQGYPPECILDLHAETAPFIAALFEIGTGEYNSIALNLLDHDECNLNLFIIDRIEILPKYRGRQLSKKLMKDAIRLFASQAEIVVLKCFPLQFEVNSTSSSWDKEMNLSDFNSDEEGAFSALSSLYQSYGFKDLGCDHIMAKNIYR